MLSLVKRWECFYRKGFALLLFISCITFHIPVSADVSNTTAEKYRSLGYAEQQKGNFNEALANYTKAIALGTESPVVYNDMGVLYEEIGLESKAVHNYLQAIKIDKHYLPPYMNLAYLLERLGDTREAAKYFKLRYELGDPQDPWALKARDELVRLRPEYDSWARQVQATSLSNELVAKNKAEFSMQVERSQEHFQRGQKHYEKGQFNKAMDEYNRALSLAPDNPKIKESRKAALIAITKEKINDQSQQAIKMLELGDTTSAKHEIQKILTAIPDEPLLISR